MSNRRLWVVGIGVALATGCALDVGARSDSIVNGRLASSADLHGTVAIPIGELDPDFEPDNCTGTLIRPNVVLSAAHCFFQSDIDGNPTATLEPTSRFQVSAGALDVFDASGDQVYGVTRFVVHPGYDNVGGGVDLGPPINDIALMVLDRDVTQVAVVPLLSPDEQGRLTVGTRVTVSGYGSSQLDAGEPVAGGTLRIAEVDVDTLGDTEMILTGAGGEDSCPGDSGGPVYLFIDGQPRVAGVVSRADPAATALCGEGGIYTLPHAFAAWIDGEVGAVPTGDGGGDGGGCSVSPTVVSGRTGGLVLCLLAGLLVSRAGRRRAR